MSASAGTMRAPRRTGMDPAVRQMLQVVLVLAISMGVIVALAALPEPTVGGDDRAGVTQTSDVDARWSPKWGAAAEIATADEGSVGDARWTAKQGRPGLDRSEARGSGGG